MYYIIEDKFAEDSKVVHLFNLHGNIKNGQNKNFANGVLRALCYQFIT